MLMFRSVSSIIFLSSLAGTSSAFSWNVNRSPATSPSPTTCSRALLVGPPSIRSESRMMGHKYLNGEPSDNTSSLRNSLFHRIAEQGQGRGQGHGQGHGHGHEHGLMKQKSSPTNISKRVRLRKAMRKVFITGALSASLWLRGNSQIAHAVDNNYAEETPFMMDEKQGGVTAATATAAATTDSSKNVKTLVIAAGTAIVAIKMGSSLGSNEDGDADDDIEVIEKSFINTAAGKDSDEEEEERLRALEARKVAAEKKLAGKIKAENRLRAEEESAKEMKMEEIKAVAKAEAEARILAEKEEAARIRAEREAQKIAEKQKAQEEAARKKAEEEEAKALAKAEEEAAAALAKAEAEAAEAQAKAEEEAAALAKAYDEAAAAQVKAEEEAAALAKAEAEEEAAALAKTEAEAEVEQEEKKKAETETDIEENRPSKKDEAIMQAAKLMQTKETMQVVEEKSLDEKYASIIDPSERAFQILVDLGMVELHDDPLSPGYDHSNDDEFVSS